MKRKGLIVYSIFNSIFFFVLSVVTLLQSLYLSQFAFGLSFLPEKLNDFTFNYLYKNFSYFPHKKLIPLFSEHADFLLCVFAVFSLFFVFCFISFTFSTKVFTIAKLDNYQFLSEKRRIRKYLFFDFLFIFGFVINSIFLLKKLTFSHIATKISLILTVFEFIMFLILVISFSRTKKKYNS